MLDFDLGTFLLLVSQYVQCASNSIPIQYKSEAVHSDLLSVFSIPISECPGA